MVKNSSKSQTKSFVQANNSGTDQLTDNIISTSPPHSCVVFVTVKRSGALDATHGNCMQITGNPSGNCMHGY